MIMIIISNKLSQFLHMTNDGSSVIPCANIRAYSKSLPFYTYELLNSTHFHVSRIFL